MTKNILFLTACFLLSACGDSHQMTSTNPPSPAAVPVSPRATPVIPDPLPNNILRPQDSSMAGVDANVPPAPSTVLLPQGAPLMGGNTPPPGAEDRSVPMNPVPTPSDPPPYQAGISNTTKLPLPADAQYPVAVPVPGHPGLVYSPFTPDTQWIDVSSYPPGSKVKCPYSGRLFRTPLN